MPPPAGTRYTIGPGDSAWYMDITGIITVRLASRTVPSFEVAKFIVGAYRNRNDSNPMFVFDGTVADQETTVDIRKLTCGEAVWCVQVSNRAARPVGAPTIESTWLG